MKTKAEITEIIKKDLLKSPYQYDFECNHDFFEMIAESATKRTIEVWYKLDELVGKFNDAVKQENKEVVKLLNNYIKGIIEGWHEAAVLPCGTFDIEYVVDEIVKDEEDTYEGWGEHEEGHYEIVYRSSYYLTDKD